MTLDSTIVTSWGNHQTIQDKVSQYEKQGLSDKQLHDRIQDLLPADLPTSTVEFPLATEADVTVKTFNVENLMQITGFKKGKGAEDFTSITKKIGNPGGTKREHAELTVNGFNDDELNPQEQSNFLRKALATLEYNGDVYDEAYKINTAKDRSNETATKVKGIIDKD